MVPLALVIFIIALIFVIRSREWLMGALVFVSGVLMAGTPWGLRVVQGVNTAVGWATGLFSH